MSAALGTTAAVSSLKRFGQNAFTGMLVASESPAGWNEETLILRFAEQNGINTFFLLQELPWTLLRIVRNGASTA